ncbi:folylpolyglutamate synthase/dihydrofolate synthase family protein [Sphingopyxis sp.]|uniref:bifunctional folylpolyglutamate synthase/dihydrofolate synthase n=1 Tax=Sphingopyxis sp. TaxID=1908224 RepID=UPI00260F2816|nr:folylpolyglutamate synthase/dihydrofolate synthase family protein [Sphingopyxis sp.]MCW0199958.1 bifunctional folylpolyglutamate synthase/dihydrofolate synthase [Sphingopyxis sp.]
MPDHAHSSDPAVQAQLDRLAALSPGRDILGLERIAELCARLGNPQDRLPPVLHVAGTNGKGSTCAFLRAAIEAEGLTTHVYSSPHLVRFNERIRIAGKLIDDSQLAALLGEVLDVADGLQASFFEVTTAAAFLAFARTPADACIVEVGLGGRLDATNIIAHPAVCGIASLGIDHEAFLLAPEANVPAAPLDRIAFEKAGIAKAGVPLVTQAYPATARAEIAKQTAKAGAMLLDRGGAWEATADDKGLHYRDARGALDLPLPAMAGAHQADNAALAVAMLRHQTALALSDEAFAVSMKAARWPARLQRLGAGPLTALLPQGTALWLDGGHNPDAGAALAKALAGQPPLHIICGLLANKDAAGFLRPIADKIASFQAVPIPGHEHHDPQALCRQVQGELGVADVRACPDVETALRHIAHNRAPTDVLVCGSLYLAGVVLDLNREWPV